MLLFPGFKLHLMHFLPIVSDHTAGSFFYYFQNLYIVLTRH